MESIMIAQRTKQMRDELRSTHTQEQILETVQEEITPHHTDIKYFIGYFAFKIVKDDILKRLSIIKGKMAQIKTLVINDNDMGNNIMMIENERKEIEKQLWSLASKIGTAHYDTFMTRSRDYESKIVLNKLTMIYKTFFEVKDELMNYLPALDNIESQVEKMTFRTNDSTEP